MPTYYAWTIGCQMNHVETDRLSALLESHGYKHTTIAEQADLIVLNTCVVRDSAQNRVENKLMRLKHLKTAQPEIKIALTGCFVTDDLLEMRHRYPFIDYFFQAGSQPTFDDLADVTKYVLPYPAAISSGITIIQGCDNFCSYCVVPYRRGREKSRPIVEIVQEAQCLVDGGARELVLLGQNVDSYGHDLEGKPDLADLLVQIDKIEGVKRIRFLTNHPKDMSSKLIRTIARLEKVCKQLNLPVQSGDNDILQRMNRGYTLQHYYNLLSEIRSGVADVAISTDIIVGFPGEANEQFENTLRFLEKARFDTVHVAMYSPRPQTKASREYVDDVLPEEKERRRKLVEEMQASIATEINSTFIGQTVEVLVEGRKRGKWHGRTQSDKIVFFEHPDNWLGHLVLVRVEYSSPWFLRGSLESKC